ncbi:MAG: flagellar export chaperone FliS [Nitrospinae bacterium]|nr:flagellar export chaperone FliS [Nitrospinota bacterium]MBF0633303.1 flagellar export chaperone FliS [Nitrospinota bacterium]
MIGYGKPSVYQATQVSTANKVQLVVLMYDGAIRFITEAKEKSAAGDVAGKGVAIGKAQRIIHELTNALDMRRGGEVATNLSQVYMRISRNLINANVNRKMEDLDESLESLRNLRGAWEQIMRQPNTAEPVQQSKQTVGGKIAISM